jgi:hypothetical protein
MNVPRIQCRIPHDLQKNNNRDIEEGRLPVTSGGNTEDIFAVENPHDNNDLPIVDPAGQFGDFFGDNLTDYITAVSFAISNPKKVP